MKIGIGVITTQTRKINSNIFNLISQPTEFYVYTDYDHKGCSYGRNECIKHLYDANCDYIFLFDDDTYPVIKGWENKIIQWMIQENVHVLGIIDIKNNEPTQLLKNNSVVYQAGTAGPFVALDRFAIEKIGYYNTDYTIYGWEDVAYYGRAKQIGLCVFNDGIRVPVWLNTYIHDMDMYGENPNPTFADDTKQAGIKAGQYICAKEVSSKDLYYDYEEQQAKRR